MTAGPAPDALYYLATLMGDKMKGGPPEQSREMRGWRGSLNTGWN